MLLGAQENDGFNALVVAAGLDAEAAGWLRAYFRYLRQTGVAYGLMTVVDALRRYPEVTRRSSRCTSATASRPATTATLRGGRRRARGASRRSTTTVSCASIAP